MTGICCLRREDDHAAGTDMRAFSADRNVEFVVKMQKHVFCVAAGTHHGIGWMLRPVVADIDHEHENASFPISKEMEEIGGLSPVFTQKLI